MKSEHKLGLAGWALLKDIRIRQYLTENNPTRVQYRFSKETAKTSQMELLHLLESMGVFRLEYAEQLTQSSLIVAENELYLVINQSLLDEVYSELEDDYEGREADYDKVLVTLVKSPEELSLNANGNAVWARRFYEGSKIELLVEYLVNTKTNKDVSRAELQKIRGLQALGDISDELRKNGLKPLKDYFTATLRKNEIKITPEATMSAQQLEQLVTDLKAAENRKSSQK